jgi:hypothetical protein
MSDWDDVRYLVHRAMDEWERGHRTGSARPFFEQTWQHLCGRVGYPGTVLEREEAWRTWLAGGQPLTRAREIELLEAAGPRAQRILVAAGLVKRREPGEEG